jgi:dTDP-L-rhamnose 4-epimerase
MSKSVLITGGAGFIGSHLADHLLQAGYTVRTLDMLLPFVPGPARSRPDYLHPAVELRMSDLRDSQSLRDALQGVAAVVHLAARTGLDYGNDRIVETTSAEIEVTARLLEALIQQPVERLVVASGMNVYGEGMYQETDGKLVAGEARSPAQLQARNWDLWTDRGEILLPVPTSERTRPSPASVHALSRFTQEQLCLSIGRRHDIPTVALRLANVYGTRLNLSGPQTRCVVAGFISRLLKDRSPLIFEDGYQQRDFVSAVDVARACRLALETPRAIGRVLNIGSGSPVTIREIAARLADSLGKEHIEFTITQEYRAGDIRHCFADIRLARELLGYEPAVTLKQGLSELAHWLSTQETGDSNGTPPLAS